MGVGPADTAVLLLLVASTAQEYLQPGPLLLRLGAAPEEGEEKKGGDDVGVVETGWYGAPPWPAGTWMALLGDVA
jgi:hypothetical protein